MASIVPERFESYARVQHVEDAVGSPPESQVVGSLPESQMRTLIEVLEDFTTTASRCWFCIWDGWGSWFTGSHKVLVVLPPNPKKKAELDRISAERDRIMRQAPVVKAQARDYFLFGGPISAAEELTIDWEGPQLWWPDDRAWCVGTDIDLKDTYVAGSGEAITRIVGAAELNATKVGPDDDVNELHPW